LVTEQDVYEVLRNCYDPEIPVNIVDLGLVYGVRVDGGRVEIDFTLTAPGCGMANVIQEDIRGKILAIEGVEEAEINIVWEPMWTPDRMSDDAKMALGMG
jgi:metal-sulfur cluster biosynthetic enzyme